MKFLVINNHGFLENEKNLRYWHEYLQLTSIYTLKKTLCTLCTQLINMKQRVMLLLRLAYHKISAIDI